MRENTDQTNSEYGHFSRGDLGKKKEQGIVETLNLLQQKHCKCYSNYYHYFFIVTTSNIFNCVSFKNIALQKNEVFH